MSAAHPRFEHDVAPPVLLGYVVGCFNRPWRVEAHLCATCCDCPPQIVLSRLGPNPFPHVIEPDDAGRWREVTGYDLPAWSWAAFDEQRMLERAIELWAARRSA